MTGPRPHRPDPDTDWPELTEWPELMPSEVSPDFVERTWSAVREDQRRIAEEAARVDEIRFPADLLSAYTAPEPSTDFGDRLMARLQDGDLPQLLTRYAAPEPSEDFVERTLAALALPVRSLRPVPRLRLTRRPRSWLALAAAVLLALLLWPRPAREPSAIATAYSPSPWATAMAEQMRDAESAGVAPTAADPLVLLARGALTEEDE